MKKQTKKCPNCNRTMHQIMSGWRCHYCGFINKQKNLFNNKGGKNE